MALITSDCVAMRLPEHQMALIASGSGVCGGTVSGLVGGTGKREPAGRERREEQEAAGEESDESDKENVEVSSRESSPHVMDYSPIRWP